jgi:TPR repeat protein
MYSKKIIPAVLGASMLFSAPVLANKNAYELGLVAYQQERFDQAFDLLQSSAKKGNARAWHLLGTMYQVGVGVEKDEYMAIHWFKKAADAGVVEAQFQLGLMYLSGQGVTSNDEMALHWICKASDKGYPQAKETLSFILSSDFGVGC